MTTSPSTTPVVTPTSRVDQAGARMTDSTTRESTIRTPDQRLRVFISSTIGELADERVAAKKAIDDLRLVPVLFELGARPHPPRDLYRAYLAQSHVFVGIYWQNYGWIAPDMEISGLEDEYLLAGDHPKLIYIKSPAPDRQPDLARLLDRIRDDNTASYRTFSTAEELGELLENDLAVMLTERFEATTEPEAASTPFSASPTAAESLPLEPSLLVGRDNEVAEIDGAAAGRRNPHGHDHRTGRVRQDQDGGAPGRDGARPSSAVESASSISRVSATPGSCCRRSPRPSVSAMSAIDGWSTP